MRLSNAKVRVGLHCLHASGASERKLGEKSVTTPS